MSYPDYPNNRLIVGGVDLTVTYQMVLLDGYTLSPPEPKTYTVDIPGGDGVIDLTSALTGDTAYENREQEFTFMVVRPEDFERVKTKVSNYLHGKEFDYEMTMDPGYTYHGRFTVESYSHALYAYPGLVGVFSVKVSAEPYKLKDTMTYELNATGGQMFRLESGRKPVHPVIECTQPCKVRWKNTLTQVPAGTFRLNDVLFTEGYNEIYINSFQLYNVRWTQLKAGEQFGMTWGQASKYRWDDIQKLEGIQQDVPIPWFTKEDQTWADLASLRWYDIGYTQESVAIEHIPNKWADLAETRWSDLRPKRWMQADYRTETVRDTTVYLQYEWKDL